MNEYPSRLVRVIWAGYFFLSNAVTMMMTVPTETTRTTGITGIAEIAINSWKGWIERYRAGFVVDGCLRCLRGPR